MLCKLLITSYASIKFWCKLKILRIACYLVFFKNGCIYKKNGNIRYTKMFYHKIPNFTLEHDITAYDINLVCLFNKLYLHFDHEQC